MKYGQIIYAAFGVGLSFLPTVSLSAADLRLRFVYDGDPPMPKKLDVDRDKAFCGGHNLIDESLLVNQENHGIANVVVYLYSGRRGTDLKKIDVPPPANRKLMIQTRNCRFEPRIVISRVGDTLVWNTIDSVGHVPAVIFFSNSATSGFDRINAERTYHLAETEPAPVPVECVIHPWERAYVLVLDHPYAATSDKNGNIEIHDLPEDQELHFRVFHERILFKEGIKVDDQPTTWDGNIFKRTFTADDQDVVTIKVSPEQIFQPK